MEKDLGRPFTRISMPISLKSGITCVCVCVCVDDVETGKASFSAYQLLEFDEEHKGKVVKIILKKVKQI